MNNTPHRLVFVVVVFAAASGFSTPQGDPGTEGGPCLEDETCDEGLVCESPCVDPGLSPSFLNVFDQEECAERCQPLDEEGESG